MLKSFLYLAIFITSCNEPAKENAAVNVDTTATVNKLADTTLIQKAITVPEPTANVGVTDVADIDTKNVHPSEVVSFAKTLIGTPYKYASTDPTVGFDCSGFITYVFNHFNIQIPRSSVDFTNAGKVVDERDATTGDLILFTGTNPAERAVGHMGLIIQGAPELQFIHSSSGKANGVTITPLNDYYRTRFVKIIRIFKENNH